MGHGLLQPISQVQQRNGGVTHDPGQNVPQTTATGQAETTRASQATATPKAPRAPPARAGPGTTPPARLGTGPGRLGTAADPGSGGRVAAAGPRQAAGQ